jgi:hypothetical protein
MALRATEAILHGDLEAGEQLARGAALRGHELGQLSGGAHFLQRFAIRRMQGRLTEELEAVRAAGTAPSVFLSGAALTATAFADTGSVDRATSVARRILGPDGSGLPRDAFWIGGVALFAGVAATARDRALVELLREMLEPCAGHLVIFGAAGVDFGPGHYWLGALAAGVDDTDAALSHLDEATSIAKELDAPYWIAQSNADAAATLEARGRPGDATRADRLRAEAIEIAESRGYGRITQQLEARD